MSKPIRVLHVLGKLHRGGAETMVMNLYRNIDRSIIQFDFVVHTELKEAYEDEIEELGGRIFRIPKYNGYNHLSYVKAWNKLFAEHPEIRVIHGHVRSTASVYLNIAKKNGRITIAHSHSTSNGKGLGALTKKILQFPIKDIADYLFAPTKESGKWLFGKKAIRNNNFYIIKNAINIKDYSFNKELRETKRNELGIADEVVVGHVGRFEEEKNHKYLIKVFNQFHTENSNSILLLVGKGKLVAEIEDLVEDLNIEGQVKFLGERSDINELMQAMDVFVFPSKYEGLGIVAIEAQTAGLPVIASDTIPREVKVTNYLKFESLELKVNDWIKSIYYLLSLPRKDNSSAVAQAGYDIQDTNQKLMKFYLDINGK